MVKCTAFVVVRTEMMKCKRASRRGSASDDVEGMREYSFLKCPYCESEDLPIATTTIAKNKYLVVNDHLQSCPKFEGLRPAKRLKLSTSNAPTPPIDQPMVAQPPPETASTDVSPSTVASTSLVKYNVADHSLLEKEMIEIRTRLSRTEQKLETTLGVVTQHQMWWGDAAVALGYERPTDPPLLVERIRMLKQEQLRDPDGALLTYKQNMTMLLDHNLKTIEQRDKTIEERDRTIDEQTQMMVQVVAQKDKIIQNEQRIAEEKDRQIEHFRKQLEEKERELKEAATTMEANEKALKAALAAQTTATNRYERVKKEKEAISAKFKAEVKAKEERDKISRNYNANMLRGLELAQRKTFDGGY